MIMMFLQFFIWGAWYVSANTYWGEVGFQGSDIGNAYSTVSLAAIIAPLVGRVGRTEPQPLRLCMGSER